MCVVGIDWIAFSFFLLFSTAAGFVTTWPMLAAKESIIDERRFLFSARLISFGFGLSLFFVLLGDSSKKSERKEDDIGP